MPNDPMETIIAAARQHADNLAVLIEESEDDDNLDAHEAYKADLAELESALAAFDGATGLDSNGV